MNFTILTKSPFAAFGFLGENVTLERSLVSDFSGAGDLEPFLGTGIRFNFWHFKYL